ncbi:MAG: SGNH/GDSL hydrolase family protein [Oscillospiraceae bacterium]|nr:SGNH/GDSL hydrolase family protein [Oscillospiraceae bacterium]
MGDSTTYGIGYYYEQGYTELCPSSQVWTPASGTLTLSQYNIATIVYPETGEELTITEAVTQAEPEYLYNITLGVNGVSFMDEEWFKRDYSALVESIRAASPDTEIVLNSIYPVARQKPFPSAWRKRRTPDGIIWIAWSFWATARPMVSVIIMNRATPSCARPVRSGRRPAVR